MTATIRHLSVAQAHPAMRNVTFPSDEHELAGRLFLPANRPKAAIVLHGATGVHQRFYQNFAEWLATKGYACLTYDYRDLGLSKRRHSKRADTTMADWGIRDQGAAQVALEAMVPDAPLWVIGHSLGGMMATFQPRATRIDRMICVASGSVDFSDHPWRYKPTAAAFWWGPGLWLRSALGYLPGRLLGVGPDLPGPAYSQWRRWCTTHGCHLADIGIGLPEPDPKRVSCPVKFVAISDDVMVPPTAVWRLMQTYPEAHKSQLTVRPEDHGLRSIGHIGVLGAKAAACWPSILA